MRRLKSKAKAVLEANDRGDFTAPAASGPRRSWDAALAAVGWAQVDKARALRELEGVVAGPPTPLAAIAARRLAERGIEVEPLLESIDAAHRDYQAARDPLGWGALVGHPEETGLAQSPVWDAPLEAVDADAAQARAHVAERAATGALGGFAVYDPALTALLLRAERDLASLGVEAAGVRALSLKAGLEVLWSKALGRYRYYDAAAGAWQIQDVLGAYLPLCCGLNEATLVEGLSQRFDTPCPLPTTAPLDPTFEPARPHRGAASVGFSWLLAPHLDVPIAERVLSWAERGGFREGYHPGTGRGVGGREFSATAALVLDWLAS